MNLDRVHDALSDRQEYVDINGNRLMPGEIIAYARHEGFKRAIIWSIKAPMLTFIDESNTRLSSYLGSNMNLPMIITKICPEHIKQQLQDFYDQRTHKNDLNNIVLVFGLKVDAKSGKNERAVIKFDATTTSWKETIKTWKQNNSGFNFYPFVAPGKYVEEVKDRSELFICDKQVRKILEITNQDVLKNKFAEIYLIKMKKKNPKLKYKDVLKIV